MITHIRISLEQFDIIDRIYRGIIFFILDARNFVWRKKRRNGNLETRSVLATSTVEKKTSERLQEEKEENASGFSEGRSMAIFHSLSSARINMH